MAQIYYMLNEKLSSELKHAILQALEQRILEPMRLTFKNDSWMINKHYWTQVDNNWNIVCWTSIAFVGLVTLNDQAERDYFITQAFKNTQKFLNNLRDDGFYNEGKVSCELLLMKIIKVNVNLRNRLL